MSEPIINDPPDEETKAAMAEFIQLVMKPSADQGDARRMGDLFGLLLKKAGKESRKITP